MTPTESTGDSIPVREVTSHAVRNRDLWNRDHWNTKSDDYQKIIGATLAAAPEAWGMLRIPEAELKVLGDVANRDILDFGCGAAQWSIALAQRGARPVGLDVSDRQLHHARAGMAAAGIDFSLVQGSGERVPLRSQSFDMAFSDGGVMSWCDPQLTVPEVARLLRPGGFLAFCAPTAFAVSHWRDDSFWPGERLEAPYFGSARPKPNGAIYFNLPHSDWIELFHRNGFAVESLIEVRPSPRTPNPFGVDLDWARKWPLEEIWKARLCD